MCFGGQVICTNFCSGLTAKVVPGVKARFSFSVGSRCWIGVFVMGVFSSSVLDGVIVLVVDGVLMSSRDKARGVRATVCGVSRFRP